MMFNAKPKIHNILIKYFKLDLRPIDYSKGWGLRDDDSHLFLWGTRTANLFKEKNNINIVGNPLSDDLYNGYFKKTKDLSLLKTLGFDDNKKTILLSAQCLRDCNKAEPLNWYSNIAEASKTNYLVIKVHPRDDINNFKAFNGRKNVTIIQHDYNFRTLLKISDVNLSHYSATSMDAVLYGIPVILLPSNILRQDSLDYWFGADIFFRPQSMESCVDYIEQALSASFDEVHRSKREAFILDMFSEHVGNSKKVVINKINNLLYNLDKG